MANRLPDEVTRFIAKHIHGFTQLELLLFLYNNPTEQVTPAMAGRELRMGDEQTAALLHDLRSRGLLVATESEGKYTYRYEPKTPELSRQVAALAQSYPKYRHLIIQLIFSKPAESVTNFAEAFRLRKDDEDG